MWPELYEYEQYLREEVLHFMIEDEERRGESLYAFQEDTDMKNENFWKNADNATLNFWHGLCKLQADWKEEDRIEDYDEIVAEYERRKTEEN